MKPKIYMQKKHWRMQKVKLVIMGSGKFAISELIAWYRRLFLSIVKNENAWILHYLSIFRVSNIEGGFFLSFNHLTYHYQPMQVVQYMWHHYFSRHSHKKKHCMREGRLYLYFEEMHASCQASLFVVRSNLSLFLLAK